MSSYGFALSVAVTMATSFWMRLCRSAHARIKRSPNARIVEALFAVKGCGDQFNNCFKVVVVV